MGSDKHLCPYMRTSARMLRLSASSSASSSCIAILCTSYSSEAFLGSAPLQCSSAPVKRVSFGRVSHAWGLNASATQSRL